MSHLQLKLRFAKWTFALVFLRSSLLQKLQVEPDLISLFLRPLYILHSFFLGIISHSININSMVHDAIVLCLEQMEQTFDASPRLMILYAAIYHPTTCLINLKVMWVNMHFLVDVESMQNGVDINFTCFIKLDMLMPWNAVRIYRSKSACFFQHRLELLEELLLDKLLLLLLLGIWIISGIHIMWGL